MPQLSFLATNGTETVQLQLPLSPDLQQDVFDQLEVYQDLPGWPEVIKAFADIVRKRASYQKLINAMLELFGYAKERYWREKLDTLLATCVKHALKYDDVISAAMDKLHPSEEGVAQPDQPHEFIESFNECYCALLKMVYPSQIPQGAAPKDHAPSSPAPLEEVCTSMATCALAMTQMLEQNQKVQRQLLQSLKGKRAAGDPDGEEGYDDSEEEPELQPIPLWHEGILSRQQLFKVVEQYDYPLNTFLKRSCTNVARALLSIKDNRGRQMSAEDYNAICISLSTAIRDVQEELLTPGGKPAQQDQEALAASLLGARYSKAAIKAKCQAKQRPPYAKQAAPTATSPYAQPPVPAQLPNEPKKDKKPFWRPKSQGTTQGTQADIPP